MLLSDALQIRSLVTGSILLDPTAVRNGRIENHRLAPSIGMGGQRKNGDTVNEREPAESA